MFTKEEVQEWYGTNAIGYSYEMAIAFLRSKGLLEENKPLLLERLRPHACSGLGFKSAQVAHELNAHQAALDKVRDGLWSVRNGDTHNGIYQTLTSNGIERAIRDGIREGLWDAPEGWK